MKLGECEMVRAPDAIKNQSEMEMDPEMSGKREEGLESQG